MMSEKDVLSLLLKSFGYSVAHITERLDYRRDEKGIPFFVVKAVNHNSRETISIGADTFERVLYMLLLRLTHTDVDDGLIFELYKEH